MINVTKPDLPDFKQFCNLIKKIWDSNILTNNGPYLQKFEDSLKKKLRTKNLLVTCNGTLPLMLAIKALELRGEIITTPFSFVATSSSIIWQGCDPVFVDIDEETFNINEDRIESAITQNTSAILVTHTFGNPCYVEKIDRIAKKHNLKVIYDAASAFDVEYKSKPIISWGDISTLSFHATKVFNSAEGGALVLRKAKLYKKAKLLRSFGIKNEDEIVELGINAKMSEFHATLGLLNLENTEHNIRKRKVIYEKYLNKLSELNNIGFQKLTCSKYNYGYFPIILNEYMDRNKIINNLLKYGIKPRKYFYPLISNLSFVKNSRELPVANRIAKNILCLPIFPDMDEVVIDKIYEVLKNEEKFIIREVQKEDCQNLAKFFEDNNIPSVTKYFDPFPLNKESAYMISHSNDNKYYVGILRGKIIGFSMIRWWKGYEGVTPGIVIDYRYQGKGFGKIMFAHFVKQGKLLGVKYMLAHVHADNFRSLNYFRKFGFKEIGKKLSKENGILIKKLILSLRF